MYANVDSERNPFTTTGLPTETQMLEMLQDDADGIRCEAAITEAELVELHAMLNPVPAPTGDYADEEISFELYPYVPLSEAMVEQMDARIAQNNAEIEARRVSRVA